MEIGIPGYVDTVLDVENPKADSEVLKLAYGEEIKALTLKDLEALFFFFPYVLVQVKKDYQLGLRKKIGVRRYNIFLSTFLK